MQSITMKVKRFVQRTKLNYHIMYAVRFGPEDLFRREQRQRKVERSEKTRQTVVAYMEKQAVDKYMKMPMRKYVKEVAPEYNGKQRVIVRFDHYGCMLAGLLQLVKVAKSDFPEIEDADIEIIHYGGERIARYFGIEFNVEAGDARLEGYRQLSVIHLTK